MKDPSGTPGDSICATVSPVTRIGYGTPELASVIVRFLRSNAE
jgi:hypothetical protein